MRYRTFPDTDLRVSEVGFGTWTLATGWWGEKTDEEAIAMMRRALDEHGINFFDAADTYGNGRAERQLAEAFRGRRDQVVYATKVGYDIYDETAVAAAARGSRVPAHGRGPLPGAAGDGPHRRAAAAQHKDGARARSGGLGDLSRAAEGRQGPGLGRGFRPGDRLALRSGGALPAG